MKDVPSDLKFYSTFQVAEILHLSPHRVRELIRTGRLRGRVHLSRCNVKRLYVVENDLRDFIHNDSQPFLERYWKGHRRPTQKAVNSTENMGIR